MNYTLRRHIFSCLIVLTFCILIPGCRTGDKGAQSASSATPGPLPPETAPTGATVLSDRTVILIGKAALPLFHQCSRASPQGVTGYWTPTAQDVAQLETDAPAFLQSQKLPAAEFFRDCRQYAGIIQGGRKVIYVNTIPQEDVLSAAKIAHPLDWQRTAIVICDGGPSIFGVEYDLQARRFQNLRFNGPL